MSQVAGILKRACTDPACLHACAACDDAAGSKEAHRASDTKRARCEGMRLIFWMTWSPFWSATHESTRPRSSATSGVRPSLASCGSCGFSGMTCRGSRAWAGSAG